MSKKSVRSTVLLILVFALSACSALPAAINTSTPSSTNPTTSIVSKLGIGLLQLEETSYAIDAAQARNLLPLWKAVKTMGADRNASQLEVEALYAQIQETLTADQVQFITELNLSASEISSLAQKYAAQSGSSAAGSQTAATQTVKTSANSSGGIGGPGGDMGGGPGGIPGVDMMGGGSTTSSSQTTAQTIAKATAAARTTNTVSAAMNVQLAASIIQLLEKRVNA